MNIRKEIESLQLFTSRKVGGTSAGREINERFESLLSKLDEPNEKSIREQYEELTGNKPGNRKIETMKAEIEELND